MAVGDNQGNVYRGQEGTGKAFRLVGDPDLTPVKQAFERERKGNALAAAKKGRAAAQKKQTRDTAKKAMDVNPEWFWAHQKEMQGQLDQVMQLGADIMTAGVDDPFSATDDASIKFQKQLRDMKVMSALSMQIKGRYGKDREKVLGDKDNKFTEGSKNELEDWYRNNSLGQIAKDGILPPNLLYNTPKMNVEEVNRAVAKGVANDAPLANFIEVAAGKGATNPEWYDNHKQMYDSLPDDSKAEVDKQAKKNGVPDPVIYQAAKWLKSYKNTDKPFNMLKATKDFKIGQITKSWYKETGKIAKSGAVTELPIKKAIQASMAFIDANSWISDRMIDEQQEYSVYKYAKNGDLEFVDRKIVDSKETAAEAVAMSKLAIAPRKVSSKEDITFRDKMEKDYGWGKSDMMEDFDVWYKALQGGLGETVEEKKLNQDRAASYLNGIKYRGYEVNNTKVIEGDYLPSSAPGQVVFDALQLRGVRKGTGKMANKNVESDPMDISFDDQESWNSGVAQELYRLGLSKRKDLYKTTIEVGYMKNMEKVDDYTPPSDDYAPPKEEEEEIVKPKGFK